MGLGVLEGLGFSVCGISTCWEVKFLGKILHHCCGNSFFPQVVWEEGQGVQGDLSKGGHWIMVYEYGYEYGFEKRKDEGTESQTQGKIQYFTLATLFNG